MERGIQIVISPLNLLGKQNVDDLTAKYIMDGSSIFLFGKIVSPIPCTLG